MSFSPRWSCRSARCVQQQHRVIRIGRSTRGRLRERPAAVSITCPLPRGHCTDVTDRSQESPDERDGVYTIWGQVTVRETSEPYPGATVEFSNLWGGNVHMDTDANGEYSLRAPADVYNAVALDLENMTVDFDVVGRPNNVVEVPPSTRVDFEAYEDDEPVP